MVLENLLSFMPNFISMNTQSVVTNLKSKTQETQNKGNFSDAFDKALSKLSDNKVDEKRNYFDRAVENKKVLEKKQNSEKDNKPVKIHENDEKIKQFKEAAKKSGVDLNKFSEIFNKLINNQELTEDEIAMLSDNLSKIALVYIEELMQTSNLSFNELIDQNMTENSGMTIQDALKNMVDGINEYVKKLNNINTDTTPAIDSGKISEEIENFNKLFEKLQGKIEEVITKEDGNAENAGRIMESLKESLLRAIENNNNESGASEKTAQRLNAKAAESAAEEDMPAESRVAAFNGQKPVETQNFVQTGNSEDNLPKQTANMVQTLILSQQSNGQQNANTATNGNSQNAKEFFIGQPQQVQGETEIKNTQEVFKPVYVSKNEIFEQVMLKTKALMNQDKSEMVISLKPEALGRLLLKVVSENGVISAKFNAETLQVKAAIESNISELKKSLEDQGIVVQSISVSVGQDAEKQSSRAKDDFKSMFLKKETDKTSKISKNNSYDTISAVSSGITRKNILSYYGDEKNIDIRV